MDTELLEKIKNTPGTNDKIFLSVTGFKDDEHLYMTECFSKKIYGIAKTSIAKAIGYDKEHYGTFEDLGEFLITRPLGGYDVLSSEDSDYSLTDLNKFLDGLENISGDDQINELQNRLIKVDPLYRPYFVRVLLKDPRMGISLKTYNSIRIKSKLKPIKVHIVKLAELLETSIPPKPDDFAKLSFPVYEENKEDGIRILVEYKNKTVKLTSRDGNDITVQYPEIVKYTKGLFDYYNDVDSITLDGEIVSSSFNALQKRMNRLEGNLNIDFDLKLVTYDITEINGKDLIDFPLADRRLQLETINKLMPEFILSEMIVCNTKEEIYELFKKAIDNKEEGIMLKSPKSKWAKKKDDRKDWWKVKDIRENTFEIVDLDYGNGKNKDVFTIVYVKDKTGNINSKVSGGLSDADKKTLTEKGKEYWIGKCVDIQYNQITSKNSLRHPRIIKFRFDKTVADTIENDD